MLRQFCMPIRLSQSQTAGQTAKVIVELFSHFFNFYHHHFFDRARQKVKVGYEKFAIFCQNVAVAKTIPDTFKDSSPIGVKQPLYLMGA